MFVLFCFTVMSSSDKPEAVEGDGTNLASTGSIQKVAVIQAILSENITEGISYDIKIEIFIDTSFGRISIPLEAKGTIPFPFMNMNANVGVDGKEKVEKGNEVRN